MRSSFLIVLSLTALLPYLSAQDQKATVYFYRVEEANRLDSRKAGLKMEGKDLLNMPEDNFVGFELPPGNYGLRMRQKQSEILLRAEAGKRYFIRVSQTVAGYGYNQNLALIPEDQAAYQMRDMKPLEDKNIKDKSKTVLRAKPSH